MEPGQVLPLAFFQQDVLAIAPLMPGMVLCRRFADGTVWRATITEVEAYRGEADLACHACKGRTARTEVMYRSGGCIYVYLVYGMYWMLNVVTGSPGDPQAVLIRAVEGINGPGRLGRLLQLDRSFYGELLDGNQRLWVELGTPFNGINALSRIGIDYAGEPWRSMPWRFTVYSR